MDLTSNWKLVELKMMFIFVCTEPKRGLLEKPFSNSSKKAKVNSTKKNLSKTDERGLHQMTRGARDG